MKLSKLGVYMDKDFAEKNWFYGINVFARFLYEILDHLRIPYQKFQSLEQIKNNDRDIIIVGFVPENREAADTLMRYMEEGGTVLSMANCNYLAPHFGYRKGETMHVGYADGDESKYKQLRFLKAVPWNPLQDAVEPSRQSGVYYEKRVNCASLGPLFQQFQVGAGTFDRCTVDIAETIVRLQQGSAPLFEDGPPPLDGLADTQDGHLKMDDHIHLDWDDDRLYTETGQPYFAYPYADLWREVLLQHVVKLALQKDLTLPFVGYWPEGVSNVATISHDSDGNKDEYAISALKILKQEGIKSTWSMLVPGYSQEIYQQIINDGHELAFHYNAVKEDEGTWGRAAFHSQFAQLKADLPNVDLVTNKNHLTRLEGWGELFEWCEETGIQMDQTRGPSKKGNSGFVFATCHPYFPIAWANDRNRFYDVVEMGFLTSDLNTGKWADDSVIQPYLDQVKVVNGVAHFLFHQIHLHRLENVRASFKKVIDKIQENGFVCWTGREINDWERLRRTIQIHGLEDDLSFDYEADSKLRNFVIYQPLTEVDERENTENVFGIPCRKIVCNAKDVIDHETHA